VWVTSDKWGPFQGHVLHTSYGKGTLFHLMIEHVEGQPQGGVVQFPLRFESGIMRGRFHPLDGQLYVCGLKGWQTSGARDAALQRVRYTGATVRMPLALHASRKGVAVTFTVPVDRASATDPENYAVEQWNYKWTEAYGSPEFSVAVPNRKGRDSVPIEAAELSDDGRTVLLRVPGLQPVMQMRIQGRIDSADGQQVPFEIHNTIHRVAEE
jgi:hypothetical protein